MGERDRVADLIECAARCWEHRNGKDDMTRRALEKAVARYLTEAAAITGEIAAAPAIERPRRLRIVQ